MHNTTHSPVIRKKNLEKKTNKSLRERRTHHTNPISWTKNKKKKRKEKTGREEEKNTWDEIRIAIDDEPFLFLLSDTIRHVLLVANDCFHIFDSLCVCVCEWHCYHSLPPGTIATAANILRHDHNLCVFVAIYTRIKKNEKRNEIFIVVVGKRRNGSLMWHFIFILFYFFFSLFFIVYQRHIIRVQND